MAWVQEFSNTGATSPITITVPVGGVPSGHFLALGLSSTGTVAPATWSVTDSRSNTWLVDATYGSKTVTATNNVGVLATCVVATTLQAGDIITATSSTGTVSRVAACVEEFDDTVTGIDIGSTSDNAGATTLSPTSGSYTTTQASELLIGVLNMVSAGRTYTANGSWTAGTKVSTVVGSGERAVVVQWRSVAATGSYQSNGTFNASATYSAVSAGYKITGGGGGGPRSGQAKVWDGSAWVSHPVKVWDGSAWVIHPAKGWDGSTWITGK